MKEGVVYRMTCMNCEEKGSKTLYFGESARTPYDRGAEHLAAIRRMDSESPLVEHQTHDHLELEPRFKMEVVAFCPSNLIRQATETHHITSSGGDLGVKLMNRRGERGENIPQD